MATFKYNDIDTAFQYVSSDQDGINSALICKNNGEILWKSEYGESGVFEEAEENGILDWDYAVDMPHKNDLDLGRDLVFDFAFKYMKKDYDKVRDFFRSRGAYRKLRDLLEKRNQMQLWYDYESMRTKDALVRWCADKGIELEDRDEIIKSISQFKEPAKATGIPAEVSYLEMPSKDIAVTKKFFTTVFCWEFEDFGPDYTCFTDEGINGGFYKSDQLCSTDNGSVLVVLYTDSLEEVQECITNAGGTIVKPTFDFPGGRRFHFADPTGNEYAVWSDKS